MPIIEKISQSEAKSTIRFIRKMILFNELHSLSPKIKRHIWHLLKMPYNYDVGPAQFNGRNIEDGLNCQALFHHVWDVVYGVKLSQEIRSLELFQNKSPLFLPVNIENNTFNMFDIVLFGPQDLEDKSRLHIAMFVGNYENQPVFLHSKFAEGVTLWTLSQFTCDWRYQKIYGVRRYSAT